METIADKKNHYRPKTKWFMDELVFIKKNYKSMTNKELVQHLNENRPDPDHITLAQLRWEMYRRNWVRMRQIRWTQQETQFLLDNYKIKGNKEIGIILTKRNKTGRKFTKKNIEKKMKLLKIKRTKEEILSIYRRNGDLGIMVFNSKENPVKKAAKEGDITIRNTKHGKKRYIKIDGKYIPYTRYFWIQNHGEVPEGHKIYHKDLDPFNDSLDNLICIKASGMSLEMIERGIYFTRKRLPSLQKKLDQGGLLNGKRKELNLELIRLSNHLHKLECKREKILTNRSSAGTKKKR